MKARSHGRTESELTERQRHWLRHIQAAERRDEPLTIYAEEHGLSVSSLYEAKRHLRKAGVIEASRGARKSRPKRATPTFVPVSVGETIPLPKSSVLRVRLCSGAILEWGDAPQGESLRELVGMLS